jgi:hypothetical protein
MTITLEFRPENSYKPHHDLVIAARKWDLMGNVAVVALGSSAIRRVNHTNNPLDMHRQIAIPYRLKSGEPSLAEQTILLITDSVVPRECLITTARS